MLIDYFLKGGLTMWPLLALSILGLAVVLEKFFLLWATKKNVADFLIQVKGVLNNKEKLLLLCENNSNILANIFKIGLRKIGTSRELVKEALDAQGRQEIRKLEIHLDWLATIAGAAPLLGFLGTVTGMVKAFQVIEKMSGLVNAQLLASGIWEALITTVFGLTIAIPCVFCYNYFVNAIQNIVLDIEDATNEMFDNF